MRYFGLLKPWQFKPNIVMLFYTKNPKDHLKIIKKNMTEYNNSEFFQLTDFYGYNFDAWVIYSKRPYPKHQKIYDKMLYHLDKQENEIIQPKNPKFFKLVKLNENFFKQIHDLDSFISRLQ